MLLLLFFGLFKSLQNSCLSLLWQLSDHALIETKYQCPWWCMWWMEGSQYHKCPAHSKWQLFLDSLVGCLCPGEWIFGVAKSSVIWTPTCNLTCHSWDTILLRHWEQVLVLAHLQKVNRLYEEIPFMTLSSYTVLWGKILSSYTVLCMHYLRNCRNKICKCCMRLGRSVWGHCHKQNLNWCSETPILTSFPVLLQGTNVPFHWSDLHDCFSITGCSTCPIDTAASILWWWLELDSPSNAWVSCWKPISNKNI